MKNAITANAGVSGHTYQHAPSDTPITDALSTDPAIEKRDVPARVWRQMAEMERGRAELVEALQAIAREPQGKTVADNASVLSAVIRIANATLAKVQP